MWAAPGPDEAAQPLTDQIGDLARQIAGLRAVSDRGKEAKARVASLLAPRRTDRSIVSDGITDDVLWSLVADMTGGQSVPAAPVPDKPNPDAELIALCQEFVRLDREWLRLADENAPLLACDPRSVRISEQQDPIEDRKGELETEIAGWTAETPEGLRALAQAARHTLSSDARRGAVDLSHGTDVAWVVLESVLAMLDAGRLAL